MEVKVTLAVICWEGMEHLSHCLPAMEEAAMGCEVLDRVLVDGGSTDGSAAWVTEHFPAWRVVDLGTNLGAGGARNRALEEASTDWVFLADCDAVPPKGAAAALLATADRFPGAAVVAPTSVFFDDPERVHYDGGQIHYAGLFSLRRFYESGAPPAAAHPGPEAHKDGGFVSVAALYDRTTVLGVGGFCEEMFILFEDLDLSFRLRALGFDVVRDPGVRVLHRHGSAGISHRGAGRYPKRRIFLHSRNRWLFLLRCLRLRTLLLTLPAQLIYEVVWAGFAVRSGAPGAYLSGKLDVIRHLGSVARARRALQRSRRGAPPGRADRDLLVGGPLTFAPHVATPGGRQLVSRAMDHSMKAWWQLVGGGCG